LNWRKLRLPTPPVLFNVKTTCWTLWLMQVRIWLVRSSCPTTFVLPFYICPFTILIFLFSHRCLFR
jgi:hypothetical protein